MTAMEHNTDDNQSSAEQNGGHAWAEETPRAGQQVQNSLHGLVDELDKLKETLGYNNELQAIEQHLHTLQLENEELRSYAEEAIKEAERLAAVNEELQGRLHQQALDEQMGAVLAETQKLKDVADEFEKDLVLQKLAEAEERLIEIQSLQTRLKEAEEENVALTQTLNEYRESTEQLQRLRLMEGASSAKQTNVGAPGISKPAAAQSGEVSRRKASGKLASSKKTKANTTASGGEAGQVTNPLTANDMSSSTGAHSRSESRTEPTFLAEQLDVVAGGAATGVVASAAKCLRDYAALEAQLSTERQETERLRHEVDELRDTMFSKSFKPPSAWAEREVKYKMEKKDWEEKNKELMGRLKQVEQENSEYRAAGKTHEFEDRIHNLEAQLLQTQREKDDAKAQLHELQITMRGMSDAQDSRYSPYRKGSVRSDAEPEGVHTLVAELEKQRIGMEAPTAAENSRTSLDEDLSTSAFDHLAKSDKLQALAKDRAQADAAWEEHSKKSDVSALRRSKAELETKVSMLEQQIGKMQWAIEHADQEQAAIEEQLDTALQTGDVNKLSGLREKLKVGLASPGKVFRKKMSPNKLAMSKQLHETTDALRSSEAERNALRRQLAKLSRKYKSMAGVGVAAGGAAAGDSAAAAVREAEHAGSAGQAEVPTSLEDDANTDPQPGRGVGSAGLGGEAAVGSPVDGAGPLRGATPPTSMPTLDEFDTDDLEEFLVPGIDDSEMEVLALREENELLMDQLVSAKVKLAEVEGEFLRSKRELLRSQEKYQQIKEHLEHAQQVEQAHEAPSSVQPTAALLSSPTSFASKAGSTTGEEHHQLSREVSASSVGGVAEGPAAPAVGPLPEKQQKRSKGWIGNLRL